MNTYEVTSTVTFILEAHSPEEAEADVNNILADIAYDWTTPRAD